MADGYLTWQEEREALHDRSLRLRMPPGFAVLLYLRRGRIVLDDGTKGHEGPALCYWPAGRRPGLTLAAGSAAWVLGLSPASLDEAVGARAESVHLRLMLEDPFLRALPADPDRPQVETLFLWIERELAAPDRRSAMSLAAILRLLLIIALRLQGAPGAEPSEPGIERTALLRRFRHLVEIHYRDHWQIARYAEALGVEYDRLHRTCKRQTGRSPAELVHDRLTAEARARVEKSGFPLKQIAEELGFADPSRFSHFFKRQTGLSPGAFRAQVRHPPADAAARLRPAFADWP